MRPPCAGLLTLMLAYARPGSRRVRVATACVLAWLRLKSRASASASSCSLGGAATAAAVDAIGGCRAGGEERRSWAAAERGRTEAAVKGAGEAPPCCSEKPSAPVREAHSAGRTQGQRGRLASRPK